MLIPYGVREVELFSYTPKIGIIGENDCEKRGCFYGVDMPPDDKFIVRTSDGHRNRTDEEINEWFTERAGIPVKMHFLSTNGMFDMFEKKYGTPRESMCSYCIGGKKPF
jgi:glutamine phosphoribosylpyrophosphate amidotransferase